MTDDRAALAPEKVTALRRALDDREQQIERERLHLRINPELPPFPGCPECDGPAEDIEWHEISSTGSKTEGDELLININSCGHRFRTPLPLPHEVLVGEDGSIIVKPGEW